ncbi:G22P2 [Mytilus edulis]|uniref:XRCC5 n=1 Tax=Mytilus edulis TaxID=6550 RepID=A0A8S3TKH0_MYTED|nr:G22P2 [Mytilus edulis]
MCIKVGLAFMQLHRESRQRLSSPIDMCEYLYLLVGTVTPVEDYLALVTRKDVNKFDEASKQMQKRIQQIVTDSFGAQFYPKAIDCLEDFEGTVKEEGISGDEIVTENLSLIIKLESEESDVSVERRKKFTEDEEDEKPKTEETPADDDAEDMVCWICYGQV